MITTEEYKELLSAKEDAETYLIEFNLARAEAEKLKADLKELLLVLTKGNEKTAYRDAFHSFEVEMDDKISKYVNDNYFEDGKILFERKVKADEQSF